MKLNSRKILKIVAVMLLIMLAFSVDQPVFAAKVKTSSLQPNEIVGNAEVEVGGIKDVANKIATVIRNFAIAAGVIMLMVIGVKYITGSAEEKADYKKSLMPLVIGIFIVMAASTLVAFVMSIF